MEPMVTCPLYFNVPHSQQEQNTALKSPHERSTCVRDDNSSTDSCSNGHPVPEEFILQREAPSEETDAGIPPAAEEERCRLHSTQPLALYCDTCGTLLCRDCVLTTLREHSEHSYGFVKEMRERLQEKLTSTLSTAEDQHRGLNESINEIAQLQKELAVCQRQCQQEIEQAYGALYRKLQESELVMKEKVAQHFGSMESVFSEKENQLALIRSEAVSVFRQAHQSLQENDMDFLKQQPSMQQRLKQLQDKLRNTPVGVPESQQVQFVAPAVMTDAVLEQQLDKYNRLYTFDPTKWRVSGSIFTDTQVNQSYTFTVENIKNGSKFRRSLSSGQKGMLQCKVELLCIRDNSTVIREVQQHAQDRFSVTIRPTGTGQHKLSVKINGAHIFDSPFSVFVQPKQPVTEIATGLQHPVSLCYSGDMLLATDGRMGVVKVSPITHAITTVVESKGIEEVTIDPQSNAIYATHPARHQLIKFTKSGAIVRTTGGPGGLPGEFDVPNGLQVSRRGELYVCDCGNNRVQVFDLDLNFRRLLGGVRETDVQFSFPSDVAFDCSGKIYIVNNGGYHLHVFAPDEQLLFVIGNQHDQLLNNPVSLAIHDKFLYVTECKEHRVSVLTTSGNLVARFGIGLLQNPEGITIDKDGYIYVTTHHMKILCF